MQNEATWISANIAKDYVGVNLMDLQAKVYNVIGAFRKHHFDIPFIVMYRQDLYKPELQPRDIWRIYQLHCSEWEPFDHKRKNKCGFDKIKDKIDPTKAGRISSKIEFANSVQELEELEKYIDFLACVAGSDDPDARNNKFKRKISAMVESRIDAFCAKACLNADQIVENLNAAPAQPHPPILPSETPAQLATKQIQETSQLERSMFSTNEKVLVAASHFIAMSLLVHPDISPIK